ncbi:hypothetical protein ACIBAG_21185 [Streptomyces sp. NPDC051243]|uniref:hypothetical protein n=1 Tax=Streptomyces sp. NPDC051243 TaxID=3365646 RepID=UPI0037A27447
MNFRRTAAVAAMIPAVLLSGATAYAAESPTATPSTRRCVAPFFEDKCVLFEITGLPRRVAAGDGWHEFTITVYNARLPTTMDDVDVVLIKQVNDLTPVMPGGDPNSVDLQARDRRSGEWRDVVFPPSSKASDYVTTDLVPSKPLTIRLRVRVAEDFPFTVTAGNEIGDVIIGVETLRAAPGRPDTHWKGQLWSGFQVLKPGTHTGETTSSPTADALSETGSSSDLVLLAGAGGAALAVAAGAVYASRRRRSTGA